MTFIRRFFRWLHEGAYFASVPFLLLMFYGVASRSRGVALFGATFAVALNVGRAAAGASGLVALLLLDGFRVDKMKKPLQRVLDPLLTIEAIVLMFTFIPWLSSGGAPDGTIADRLESGARDLGREMRDVLGDTIRKAAEIDAAAPGDKGRRPLDSPPRKAAGEIEPDADRPASPSTPDLPF
jgi:hypothetical protein